MAVNLNDLFSRFSAVETEVKINQRKREEEAREAVSWLQRITDEDVERCRVRFPLIAEVRSYTVEELLSNRHGEEEKLQRLYSEMTHELDKKLKYLEDLLC